MAVDMFLGLKGIQGESLDNKHGGEIDVLAWSWGMSQAGSFHHGGGGGSGKVSVQDISLTKYIDKSSPNLMLYCSNGKHIPEGTLTVRKAGGDAVALEYLVIKMKNILITSISTGGSGGEDRLTENVTLHFARVDLEYTPQKPDGSGAGAVNYKWNMQKNAQA